MITVILDVKLEPVKDFAANNPLSYLNTIWKNNNGFLNIPTNEEDCLKSIQWFENRPYRLMFTMANSFNGINNEIIAAAKMEATPAIGLDFMKDYVNRGGNIKFVNASFFFNTNGNTYCPLLNENQELVLVQPEKNDIEKLIAFYKNRLEVMKQNRATDIEIAPDAENDLTDQLIRQTAEFIQDLKALKV